METQVKIKICGLRTPADVAAVNVALPEYAGFIFVPMRRRYVAPAQAAILCQQLDPRIRPVGVDLVRADNQTTVLRMTLFEGRNRQIRKMCEIADLKVRSLTRVAIGGIKLADLPSGSWRELSKKEILLLGGHPATRPSNG